MDASDESMLVIDARDIDVFNSLAHGPVIRDFHCICITDKASKSGSRKIMFRLSKAFFLEPEFCFCIRRLTHR